MKKKTIIIIAIIGFALAGGGWYAYSEYTRKVKDLATVSAEVQISAAELISAFESNEGKANTSYLDKIIAVKGPVRSVEKNDQGHFTVILGEAGSLSAVRCSMDSSHQEEVASLPEGSLVTMKGACTGFNADEMLGSDVILNRAVLQKD
jgi:hypothetical protein